MRELFRNYDSPERRRLLPNRWDIAALLLVFTCLALLASAARQMAVPYHLGQEIAVSLLPSKLPGYAMQTVLRMFIALFFSLLFTFTVSTLAAKNRHAEKIILPLIDILQSVPVMGFLSITVVGFIALFPGSLWGAQCAAIFAIFTSQVWNMAFSFYQSLRTLPAELREAADMAAVLAGRSPFRHAGFIMEHDAIHVCQLVFCGRFRSGDRGESNHYLARDRFLHCRGYCTSGYAGDYVYYFYHVCRHFALRSIIISSAYSMGRPFSY
jgi:hypothetical protein